ncbi:MAG: ThiF family adenylyltransferase [Alphaproteobacteria bacterium]
MRRYTRQLALPDLDLVKQERLMQAHILMVGAGGLGAVALPYLAGAGIGAITIVDHDEVDITNLHRQTIYRSDQAGQNKAVLAKAYLEGLNPECTVGAITDRLTGSNAADLVSGSYDVILDGSDNFETKALLNDLSISLGVPLISASVNQFSGQIGIFEGYRTDKACYRCLFPKFPTDARNCNEAGILGSSAGLIGVAQAHLCLSYLLDIETRVLENFLSFNLKTLDRRALTVHKDPDCVYCKNADVKAHKVQVKDTHVVDLISIDNLNDVETVIVDVRQPEEILADPLVHTQIQTSPLHIPLPELLDRLNELPEGMRWAFVCAGNIRSRQAAEYLSAKGYEKVCILDKFTI